MDIISSGDSSIQYRRIQDPKDRLLPRFNEFLRGMYADDPNVVDPLYVTQSELINSQDSGYECPLVVYVALRGKEIVAAASANFFTADYSLVEKGQTGFSLLCYSCPETNDPRHPITHTIDQLVNEGLQEFADSRNVSNTMLYVEAQDNRRKVYETWGARVLDGVDYVQPPLRWDPTTGKPLMEEVPLALMAKPLGEHGERAVSSRIIRPDMSAMRRGMARQSLDGIFDFYIPGEDDPVPVQLQALFDLYTPNGAETERYTPEALQNIEKHIEVLRKRAVESLGARRWIGLRLAA